MAHMVLGALGYWRVWVVGVVVGLRPRSSGLGC